MQRLERHLQARELLLGAVQLHADVFALPVDRRDLGLLLPHLQRRALILALQLLVERVLDAVHHRVRAEVAHHRLRVGARQLVLLQRLIGFDRRRLHGCAATTPAAYGAIAPVALSVRVQPL